MAKQTGSLDLAAARKAYESIDQYFWYETSGTEAGAHITEVPQDAFTDPNDPDYHTGGNLLARSTSVAVRNGTKELAAMSQAGFDAKTYDSSNNEIIIAHLGYGPGIDSSGATTTEPYYTLGERASGQPVGNYSLVEGQGNTASAFTAHAEGYLTTATGWGAHAEGRSTTAVYDTDHAEGDSTTASGGSSHAEGVETEASERWAHAQNQSTIANQWAQTVIGTYNIADTTPTTAVHPGGYEEYGHYALIIGNGYNNASSQYIPVRSNALTVDWDGNTVAAGRITAQGHSSPIGDRASGRKTGTYSCASGTSWVSVPTNSLTRLTLGVGVWIVTGHAQFASSNNGRRSLCIYNFTDSNRLDRSVVNNAAISGTTVNLASMAIVVPTTDITVGLQVQQNSGSSNSIDLVLEAVRIA